MSEHNEQLTKCFADKTCVVIGRGLAECRISGKLCDPDRCPRRSKKINY